VQESYVPLDINYDLNKKVLILNHGICSAVKRVLSDGNECSDFCQAFARDTCTLFFPQGIGFLYMASMLVFIQNLDLP
jgi:hypothetical protein